MTALRNAAQDSDDSGRPAADPEHGRWSAVEMLLAQVVDELRGLRWTYVQANSEKGRKVRPPEPLPRPGATPRRQRMALRDAMKIDPRLRLTTEKARKMTAAELADYAEALMDDDGRLTLRDAMAQLHAGREKAREAIALAVEARQARAR
jgi:hypothetical protein